MPCGSCGNLDVGSRGIARPLPNHLLCVEKFTLPLPLGNSEIVSPFTIHTLGNTNNAVLDRGGHSYAVMEICNAAILLAFLFQVRSQLEEMSDRIRHGGHALTAADFTVMVSNVPRHWRSEQLRAHFEKFGAVVHVGVSLDYRELTLAMQE